MAAKKAAVDYRSDCPIASALDLVGDKWSLLVMRDVLLFDKSRYADFRDGDEGIPQSVLSDRLKRLESLGLLQKRLYSEHPPRYEYLATKQAFALAPVLHELAAWAIQMRGYTKADFQHVIAPLQDKVRRLVQTRAH